MTVTSGAVDTSLLDGLTLAAARASAAILAVRERGLEQREKDDHSPVTNADIASEAAIMAELARLAPGIPVVSEETQGNRPQSGLGGKFFLIDPLDGTREFIAGRDEYTVNVALIENGSPVVGVLAAPSRGLIWRGVVGCGAERLPMEAARSPAGRCTPVHTRARPASGARVLVSRSHLDANTEALVARLDKPERIACGSALKFGLLAEGTADLYPRLAPTSEWDIAAGHALLSAAGGQVTAPGGKPLVYGLGDFLVPAFIAAGDSRTPLPD